MSFPSTESSAPAALVANAEELRHVLDVDEHFMRLVAHELRAPLHAIRGWTYVLRTGGGLRADQVRALEAIERNTLAQARLIDELEDNRRVLCGAATLNPGPVALATLIEHAVEAVEPFAATKHVGLEAAHDMSIETVWGDEQRLRQALANLLAAAVKFSAADATISVRSGRRSDSLVIDVYVSPITIDPALLPSLFDTNGHARTHSEAADAMDGLRPSGPGLPLLVAREVVALHGGRLHAMSDASGYGAVLTLELPQPGL